MCSNKFQGTAIPTAQVENLRTRVTRWAFAGHAPGAIAWELFEIDAKFVDIESTESFLEYLVSVNPGNDT